MFLDQVRIWVRGGDGGDGAATFRREAHVPRGGPDGGDGGRGGSVYLTVDPGETSLRDFRHAHHFKAVSGGRGAGQRMHGRAGSDLTLKVPPGTGIFDDESGELIGDLVASEQTLLVGRGGRGGLGNVHFATSTHQTPHHAQKGEPGEDRWIRLELRLIADVGLVGLPNAGKSTLLAAVTAATPKIADYPFTTLEPNLGVLDLGDEDSRRPTIADVPGLIEGASSGAGLGHAFLRHVERTRILVHIVDGSDRDPEWNYNVIRDELAAHDPALLEKPALVAFNKMDRPRAAEAWAAFQAARRAEGVEAVAISASEGDGLAGLRARLAALLPDAAELAEPREPTGVVVHRLDSVGDAFRVEREDGVLVVHGKKIERLAAQTNFEVEESAERFQRDLVRLGIDEELRRRGVAAGETVRIGGSELEWEPDEWDSR
ncbi:MAG TPA: GTPase ObgE [Candidatus Limnocylindrales bacterium]|nr:GTPase ObgE [Candidatus Limnocylindrales bacterium]